MSIDEPRSQMSIDEPLEVSIELGETHVENDSIEDIIPAQPQPEKPKVPHPLPTHILPSNDDVVFCYKFKRQSSSAKTDTIVGQITEEILTIWKSTGIPTLNYSRVKQEIKKIIKKGTGNKMSKKAMKISSVQGFLNGPNDCFIISHCRHFIKAKNKSQISLDLCDCQEENKIPLSRLSFFQSNLFDR